MDSACQCIETKHLFNIEGLSEEGQGFSLSEKERRFYARLAEFARDARKSLEMEDYVFPTSKKNTVHLTACEKKRATCLKTHSLETCITSIPCP